MFLTVRGKADRMHEVSAYLYAGQEIVSEPVETRFGTFVIVESAHGMAGRMLAGRLSSGNFGVSEFETLEDAQDYIESEKAF